MRALRTPLTATALLLALAACEPPAGADPNGNGGPDPDPRGDPPAVETLRSDLARDVNPAISASDLALQVAGNTDFAFALLDEAARDAEYEAENLFFSPYSISVALAMTYAGALDQTAEEMAATLRFDLDPSGLHPAFNALDLELSSRGDVDLPEDEEGEPFELSVVNAIWGQADYPFLEPFLDTLAVHYDAPLYVMDFEGAFEDARETINDWVAHQTWDRIQDLLPKGSVNELTRLVLTNAIYFQASWKDPFDPDRTEDAPFHLRDGGTVQVPMMRQHEAFAYAEVDGVEIVSLPYVGGEVSMLVLLPEDGGIDDLVGDLDHARFQAMVGALAYHRGPLALPRFSFDAPLGLKDLLERMGMEIPFDPFGANFRAMADLSLVDDMNLYISDVLHKAFVAVDEEGTEAAAATAVIVAAPDSAPGEPPFEMTVDRPFVFAIYDHPTETVLFLGRVLDPS